MIHPEITPNWWDRTDDDGALSIPDESGIGREFDWDRIEDQRVSHTVFDS